MNAMEGDPFAVRTILGWSLLGGTVDKSNHNLNVNFVRKTNELFQKQVECLWKLDNMPTLSCLGVDMSKNDQYAMKILEESQQYKDGHYKVGLLWHPGASNLKTNYRQALQRLQTLKQQMQKDENFCNKYTTTMENYIAKGYATLLTNHKKCHNAEECWYLQHYAVFHPHKPNKIRVVFDCTARQHRTSLNEQLLPGSDLLNSLIEVLSRFQKGRIALVADIEAMYHQVLVDPKDKKYLRFL